MPIAFLIGGHIMSNRRKENWVRIKPTIQLVVFFALLIAPSIARSEERHDASDVRAEPAMQSACIDVPLHFPNELIDVVTGQPLTNAAREAIVLIHGWTGKNAQDVTESYNRYEQPIGTGLLEDGALQYLYNTLRFKLSGTSTRFVAYRWERDASTGAALGSYGTAGYGNATVAAVNAQEHGRCLAQLLDRDSPDLRAVHLIAHSAGSWAAREAARSLLELNPYVIVQITLLDPFIPVDIVGGPIGLSKSVMNATDAMPGSDRLNRLQNYYSRSPEAPSTSEEFIWRNSGHTGRDANLAVDWAGVRYYFYHSGPLEFYADTVSASLGGQPPVGLVGGFGAPDIPFSFIDTGWYRSLNQDLLLVLPRISAQPQPQSVVEGTAVSLSVTANRASTYQWYKDDEPYSETSATLSFPSVTASNAGHYLVRVGNSSGYTFSEQVELRVTAPAATVPLVSTGVASAITQSSATISATVTPNGSNTTLYFDYGRDTAYGTSLTYGSVGSGTTAVTRTQNLNGLSCGTTYHYRARASNGVGPSAPGQDRTLRTNDCALPAAGELLTNGSFAANVYGWAVTGNFYADARFTNCLSCPGYAYLSNGDGTPGNNRFGTLYQLVAVPANATSATLSFWYNITSQETTSSTPFDVLNVTAQTTSGAFLGTISVLSNLDETTGYRQRTANLLAYAGQTIRLNFTGTTDGGLPTVFRVDDVSVQVVTATSSAPTVTTQPASAISATSATLNATVNPNGAATTAYFEFGINAAMTENENYGSVGSGTTAMSVAETITGLTCGTTYYFRARADNTRGAGIGTESTFVTSPCVSRIISLSGNLIFGGVEIGSTASSIVTITNLGTSPLRVGGFTIPHGFRLAGTGGTIQPNGFLNVTVTFEPIAAIGYGGVDRFIVDSDNTGGNETMTITGTGISLLPPGVFLREDFENGVGGWNGQSPWTLSTETARSGTHAWTDSPGGPYAPNVNTSLISPVIDLSGAVAPSLTFWSKRDIAPDGVDAAGLWITTDTADESAYRFLSPFQGSFDWAMATIDLSPYAGLSAVQLVFQMFSNGSISADGWTIDDVTVYNAAQAPPVVIITNPSQDTTHYTNTSRVALLGTITASSSTQITCTNAATGTQVTATSSWECQVDLVPGDNEITVSARDASNSEGTDRITVTYVPLPPGTYFLDPDEAAAGWRPDTPWSFSTEAAHSGARSWSDSPGGQYGPNVNSSLALPPLDLRNAVAPRLEFWQRHDFAADGYDSGNLWASTDGGQTYTFLRKYSVTDLTWAESTVDLSAFVGFATVRIYFQMLSDVAQSGDGWYIDDVIVREAPGVPGSAPTISVQPRSQIVGWQQSATLFVAVTGSDPLSYEWYSGSTGVTTSPIEGATSSSYVTPALATSANYWVRVTNPYGAVDSATAELQVRPAGDFFVEDMESGAASWSPQVPWALTTEFSHSGTTAWSDSPDGPYGLGVNSSLAVPPIDLRLATVPQLRFWQRRDFASDGYDSGNVWVSTDNGQTYTYLTKYTGIQLAWTESAIDLSQFAGQPSVRVYFQVLSDAALVADGWYIDDIVVRETVLPSAFSKLAPVNGEAAESMNPDLIWEASIGATTYEYCIDTTNNDSCDGDWISTPIQAVAVNSPGGARTSWWQVRARNAAGSTEANGGSWWSLSYSPPTVTGIAQASGSIFGGTPVTITGTGFAAGAVASIGGIPVNVVSVVDATTIEAITGPHAAGIVDVDVMNPDLQHGILPAGFTYVAPSIVLGAATALPNGLVTATFANGPRLPGDWWGVFLTGSADSSYCRWGYMNGLATKPTPALSGATLAISVCATSGAYEVRWFRNDSYIRLATSAPIGVVSSSVSVTPTTINPSALVTATFSTGPGLAGDWWGVFLAGAADSAYCRWGYMNGLASKPNPGLPGATLPITMCTTAGTYEVRWFRNDSYARLATSPPITVVGATVTVTPTTITPNTAVTATLANGPGFPGDWWGVFLAGAPDSGYCRWGYMNGLATRPAPAVTGATFPITMCATAGTYEVRWFRNDSLTRLATSAPITVVGSTVTVSPSTVAPNAAVTATFANGPGLPGDWWGVFLSGAADGAYCRWGYMNGLTSRPNPALTGTTLPLTICATPGTYEIRWFRNDSFTRLGTSTPITVVGPTVSVTPTTIAPGAVVTATLANGPGLRGDWWGVFLTGAADGAYCRWGYMNGLATRPSAGLTGATLPVTMCATPGTYEVRWFRNDSLTRMASSNAVAVGGVAPITLDDAFNTNQVDSNRWGVESAPAAPAPIVTVNSINQRLEIQLSAGNGFGGGGLYTRCSVSGDFDVQVDGMSSLYPVFG